jgi:hypothetical protein
MIGLLLLLVAGCGGSTAVKTTPKQQLQTVRQALITRLRQKQLDFRWVVCLRNGRVYKGTPIVRCNVDFGDPHVEVYCTVLDDGRLVTNHEDSAIPCSHDDAGAAVPVQGS